VAEVEGLLLGLAVDEALGVIPGPAAALSALPALATRAGSAAGRALLRRPGAEPVLVLSLEHVLERVRASARPGIMGGIPSGIASGTTRSGPA